METGHCSGSGLECTRGQSVRENRQQQTGNQAAGGTRKQHGLTEVGTAGPGIVESPGTSSLKRSAPETNPASGNNQRRRGRQTCTARASTGRIS